MEFATRTLKASPAKITKIWAIGERAHSLLADSGLNPAGLLSVPISINAITPLVGQILIEIEAAQERGDVEKVYVFHNRPKTGALLRSRQQTAPATRSRLARQASRNALAHEDSAGSD